MWEIPRFSLQLKGGAGVLDRASCGWLVAHLLMPLLLSICSFELWGPVESGWDVIKLSTGFDKLACMEWIERGGYGREECELFWSWTLWKLKYLHLVKIIESILLVLSNGKINIEASVFHLYLRYDIWTSKFNLKKESVAGDYHGWWMTRCFFLTGIEPMISVIQMHRFFPVYHYAELQLHKVKGVILSYHCSFD